MQALEENIAELDTQEMDKMSTLDTKMVFPIVTEYDSSRQSAAVFVHVGVPRFTKSLCFGSQCRPVICPLLLGSLDRHDLSKMSYAPTNAKLFLYIFYCQIIAPLYWKEYADTLIGNMECATTMICFITILMVSGFRTSSITMVSLLF